MCQRCQLTQTFDPTRHETVAREYAEVFEGADAFGAVTTAYGIDVGDSFIGQINRGGDSDWVRIALEGGTTYDITLRGVDSGGGTLADPYLEVYNASGTRVAEDDDGGTVFDSALSFSTSVSGTYYLGVRSFDPAGTGSYTLAIEAASGSGGSSNASATNGTLDQMAAYLTDGYWEASGGARRSFDTSTDNTITVDIDALTAEGQQLAHWAFEAWELVIDVDFREVSVGADITFDDNEDGAFASSTMSRGRILEAEVNVSQRDWIDVFGATIDSQSFSTYIHEIGHALGLGHLGDYNGDARYGRDETFTNDSVQVSVMSYFTQTENTSITASRAEPITAMLADVAAAQSLYGAAGASSASAGDTVWGRGSNLGGYLDTFFSDISGATSSGDYAGGRVAFTVTDVSGIDTVDLSFTNRPGRYDMRAEQFSDVDGLVGNVGISRGTVIERLIAGDGSDRITGNDVANRIEGGFGDDTIESGAAGDVVFSNGGNDEVRGGTGADTLNGGFGNDTLEGESAFDFLYGGAGNDSLVGGTGVDSLFGEDGNDTLYSNTGVDSLDGGAGDDFISAGDGVDVARGGDGNDTVYGRSGEDSLYGDAGNDTLYGSQGIDYMYGGGDDDFLSGGSAWDQLWGDGGDDTLYGNFGSDNLRGGAGADSLYGGTGDDTLTGGAGNDALYGNQGRDRLDGGAGDDLLRGGTLSDLFIFAEGHGRDRIEDFRLGEDQLQFSRGLTDGLTDGDAVVRRFAEDAGATVVFDFGSGDTITLESLGSLTGLGDAILVV